MKIKNLIIFTAITFIFSSCSSFALIKIDDNSIDLAIRYYLKTQGSSSEYDLGSNWKNDGKGRILNIYSPFIQIVMKSTNKGVTGNLEEDVKNIKTRLSNEITKIKTKNEVRFIVALYGDNSGFAQKYKASIVEAEYIDPSKIKKALLPKSANIQKVAEKDSFDPSHPFSAVNCYIYKFDDIFKLKNFVFILSSENGEEIKYKINSKEIY